MSCEEIFLKQLHQRGFRLTPQREQVLLVLHQLDRAASADEIYTRVASLNPNVELSTVYRTLDLLNSLDLVAVIDVGDRQRLFELCQDSIPHLHLVCRVCGKIVGVELDLLQPLLDHVTARLQFHTDLSNISIPGICATCAPGPV